MNGRRFTWLGLLAAVAGFVGWAAFGTDFGGEHSAVGAAVAVVAVVVVLARHAGVGR